MRSRMRRHAILSAWALALTAVLLALSNGAIRW
jgi:hypothetical protein